MLPAVNGGALAKELKEAGDKEAAAEVKELPRPTVAAWAVNHLAHLHPGKLAELDDVGRRLRDAHEALLDGNGNDAVRAATAGRRKVVDRLADLATNAIGPSSRSRQSGAAHQELDAPSGFAGLSFVADAPVRPATMQPKAKEPLTRERKQRRAELEQRAARAQEAVDELD